MRIFLLFIGVIAAVIWVIFIYDARPTVKKYFSFGDKNDASLGLKMFGFLLLLIGSLLIYFNF